MLWAYGKYGSARKLRSPKSKTIRRHLISIYIN
jgi:hypothetical protein